MTPEPAPRAATLAEAPVWITWERQRRSIELAEALGATLHVLTSDHRGRIRRLWRYGALSFRTLNLVMRTRPRLIFCQNPSIVLAALMSLWKGLAGCRLVVDRHSNFDLDEPRRLHEVALGALSRYSLRRADLTIVTNTFLAGVVESSGGRAFVLEDRLPRLDQARLETLSGEKNIAYVCTYSGDEPVEQVLEAAALLDPSWRIYVTGRPRRRLPAVPPNVVLTGFLSEARYQSLLHSADLVMVLTTQEHTLTCGAYEAVTLGKAMVLSETEVLQRYFCKGAVYTRPDAASIAAAIRTALDRQTELESEVEVLRAELRRSWQESFARLRATVSDLCRPSGVGSLSAADE